MLEQSLPSHGFANVFFNEPSYCTEVPQVVFDNCGHLRCCWSWSYLFDCLLEFHFENSTIYPGDVDNVYHFTHAGGGRGGGGEVVVSPQSTGPLETDKRGDGAEILSLGLITGTEYWQFLIHYNNKPDNFASIFQSERSMVR